MSGDADDPAAHRDGRPTRAAWQRRNCEAFLVDEARLLDEARFEEWLALFTLDAQYWVPSAPAQVNPHDTVSLIYDDRRLLEARVRRLASPRIYSQEPRSRTTRIVTNLTIEEAGAGFAVVRSKFMMIEFRRDEQRVFGGTYLHRLHGDPDHPRIRLKRVDLVNCDAPLEGLVVPF
jgi:3-phenylpropionate/cinnamic acid dioxygenase small subunit